MITGEGLIGKLVLFAAEKLISQKLTISLDEKKRACRAFVELYHCMDRIEGLNTRLVSTLEQGTAHGGLLIGDIEPLIPSINSVSQRFLDIRHELYFALDLIDPTLSRTVSQLYSAKGSFLLLLSRGINPVGGTGQPTSISYLAPDPRILSINMDDYHQWVADSSSTAEYVEGGLDWPQNILWFGEYEEGFQEARLDLSDSKSLKQLRDILVAHGAVLSDAREQLRRLIVAKFSTEDILYVSKDLPRDEF